MQLLDRLAAGEVFTLKDLEKGMGRLQWATSACPLTKPLLQPLWQWKGAVKSSGKPPLLRCYDFSSMSPVLNPLLLHPGRPGTGRVMRVLPPKRSTTSEAGFPLIPLQPNDQFSGFTSVWTRLLSHGFSKPKLPVP